MTDGTPDPQPPYTFPEGLDLPAPPAPPVAAAPPAPQYAPPAPQYTPPVRRGFLGSLFDLSFSEWITDRAAKVVFIVSVALIAVETLVGTALLLGISTDEDYGSPVFLLLLPVLWGMSFLMIVGVRLGLEAAVVRVQTARATAASAHALTELLAISRGQR